MNASPQSEAHGKKMPEKYARCVFKMAYNKAKDGHVKHSKRINKISLSLARAKR